MKISSRTWLFLFAALAVGHLASLAAGWPPGEWLTKPLLMPVLAAWFFRRTNRLDTIFSRLVFAGLWWSWLGDVFLLMVPRAQAFFLLGLGSFLVAHLCYLLAFLKFSDWKKGWVARRKWPALFVVVYLFFLLDYLWPHLPPAFRWPVAAYAVVISAMLLGAMNLVGRMRPLLARQMSVGALLFVFSDSLIAVTRFTETALPPVLSAVAIMLTYLTAQYFLAAASAAAERASSGGEDLAEIPE